MPGRRLAILVAFALVAIPGFAEDRIDRYVRAQMERAHIPGAAVAVVRNGRVEKLSTYGVANLEHSVRVTTDTAFQIASSTKLFTAALVADLVAEGRLDPDAPIANWLADVPEPYRKTSLAQLLAHASGMTPKMVDVPSQKLEDAVHAALAVPPSDPAGARSAYGSDDFSVVAAILEEVGGKPFPELLRERVFAPLGMGSTRFEYASPGPVRVADVVPHRASVYQWQGDRQRLHWFAYPQHTWAAGGAFSTIRDLSTFLLAVDRGKVAPPAVRERVWKPLRLNDGSDAPFALGWSVSSLGRRRIVGHSGGPALCDLIYLPEERLGVVVLTNQQRLIPAFARGIAMQLLRPAPLLPATADPDPARTAADRKLALAISRGKLDPSATAPPFTESLAETQKWGELELGALPPLEALRFVAESGSGGKRVRSYDAVHAGWTPIRWTLTTDAAGKLVDVDWKAQ